MKSNSFPLQKNRLSNEYIMTAIFFVLLLYLLPEWIKSPHLIFEFTAILALSLLIDAGINFIRWKHPVCAVSAVVTVGILQILIPGVPFVGKLFGIVIAIVFAKHLFGGTGKNIFNPAIFALLIIRFFFNVEFPFFQFSWILIPALFLSLPFIFFRPFAAVGLMIGMMVSLFVAGDLNFNNVVTYGVIFFGSIVITDPVTNTSNPVIGGISGLIIGILPLFFTGWVIPLFSGLLLFNLFSFIIDKFITFSFLPYKLKMRIKMNYEGINNVEFIDLTENGKKDISYNNDLKAEEILIRIKNNGVFGQGGSAFQSYKKIESVKNSNKTKKYFIINACECDPGLVHDKWILNNKHNEISQGIKLICKCQSFDGIFIAVKEVPGIDFSSDIKVIKVPDYYPVGYERNLIKYILKQDIPMDKIPAFEGILVLNIQTILSAYDAVFTDREIKTKYLTLANIEGKNKVILNAGVGDKVYDIVNKVYPDVYSPLFVGGGFMQSYCADEDTIVDKETNFIAIADFPYYKESQLCSKCNFCMTYCPSSLQVRKISYFFEKDKIDLLKKYHPEKCIDCGLCSYICPAGKNLSAKVKMVKDSLKL